MNQRITSVLALLATVAWPAAYADDDVSISPAGKVLHERLPPPRGARSTVPVFVYDPEQPGSLPREFQRDGVAFPAPAAHTEVTDDEARYAPAGVDTGSSPDNPTPAPGVTTVDPRGTLGGEALPDRDTEKEGTISYHTSFDPSVVPFKRNRVLDTVTAAGTLTIGSRTLEPVTPAGTQSGPGREVFWGSVLLQGRAGDTIPLPSVAAGSRVLSMEASPPTPLTLWRDGADNFYVRLHTGDDDARMTRLVFLVDAPEHYFGRSLPGGHRTTDVPHARRPTLPASMQRSADVVAARLGLSSRQDYRTLVRKLVRHFRSFEPGAPPPDSGNVYRDLALGKRGICRHRAYAFVITAHGLGIPARYVFNEAHVFVEVWIPGDDPGWLRVDLGGAAERLVVAGGEDKLRHVPGQADPFDRPAAYARQMRSGPSAGASSVVGLPPTHRRTPKRTEALAPSRTGLLPPPRPLTAVPGATTTTTTLSVLAPVIYRGEPFEVRGQVTRPDGQEVTGRVRLVLLDATKGEAIGLLQTVELGPDGAYTATLTIPGAQPPGGYEVVAEYLGGLAAAPSRSP